MKSLKIPAWTSMAPQLSWLWLALALLAAAGAAQAQVVGTVTHLSGLLSARHADGSRTLLAVKSSVRQGDTLVTERDTYARVKFVDSGEIVLRPGSEVVVAKYIYDENKPESDSVAINLVKGGLRAVTGLLGKRNHEAIKYETPVSTIGIRGTTFIAQYVPPPSLGGAAPAGPSAPPGLPVAPGAPVGPGLPSASPPPLAPGLHLSVTDGAIIVTNSGGSLGFQAGQFGFVPSVTTPPIIVPSNPNVQFVPPPSFNTGSGGPTASSGPGSGNAVDCVVR
jgi:hypothetical protein